MRMASDQVTLRASPIARSAALVLGVSLVALSAWALVEQVRDPDPAALGGFLFLAIGLFVARGVRKVEIAAGPEGLRVHTGWREFTVPWERVEGFWIRERWQYGGVYVLIAPGDIVMLPLAQAVWPAKPNES